MHTIYVDVQRLCSYKGERRYNYSAVCKTLNQQSMLLFDSISAHSAAAKVSKFLHEPPSSFLPTSKMFHRLPDERFAVSYLRFLRTIHSRHIIQFCSAFLVNSLDRQSQAECTHYSSPFHSLSSFSRMLRNLSSIISNGCRGCGKLINRDKVVGSSTDAGPSLRRCLSSGYVF